MAANERKGTDQGPTHADATRMDEAHRAAGDGTLQGAVPAGLTADELRKRSEQPNPDAEAATD